MTRSEERLHVGTEQVQTGRARLRKYVVTEQQTVTVPVSREEVRLEREPITDANIGDALAGPEISEEEHEVILTEERPVVAKETVPVERVRLDTDTVTEQRAVTESVRKEEIELDGPTPTPTPIGVTASTSIPTPTGGAPPVSDGRHRARFTRTYGRRASTQHHRRRLVGQEGETVTRSGGRWRRVMRIDLTCLAQVLSG